MLAALAVCTKLHLYEALRITMCGTYKWKIYLPILICKVMQMALVPYLSLLRTPYVYTGKYKIKEDNYTKSLSITRHRIYARVCAIIWLYQEVSDT